ncbi:PAS domain S-box protein [bacterium]|nr:PAS domain S-box protein [bacterium]
MPQLVTVHSAKKISEATYQTLFDHSGNAVAVVSEEGRLLMVNRKFEELSGLSRREIEGRKTVYDFFREDHDRIDHFLQKRGKRTAAGVTSCESRFFGLHEEVRSVYVTVSDIPRSHKFLLTLADVTELRELQSRLARSEQLAAIGELAASIAHEIRNPLGAINTSVEVLSSSLNLDGEDRDLMQIIQEETRRLDRIVKDFLLFARLDRIQSGRVDLNQIIRDTLFLFKGTFNSRIKVTAQLDAALPLYTGDGDQLRQVLINLIVNSMEAMTDGGTLLIRTKRLVLAEGRTYVQLLVQDSGQGIEAAHLKNIFKPFFSTKEKGVGMGLAICQRIIQNHGGEIDVSSRLGNGATFIITLPVVDSAPEKE